MAKWDAKKKNLNALSFLLHQFYRVLQWEIHIHNESWINVIRQNEPPPLVGYMLGITFRVTHEKESKAFQCVALCSLSWNQDFAPNVLEH